HFIPHMPDQTKLYEKIRSWDIFVMPTVYRPESLGVAAIEAAAMGIPVVASNFGGIPEVVIQGVSGFLVEPGSAEQIAEAISTLVRDSSLRLAMGTAGRKMVLEKYDWQHCVESLWELYHTLC
ncbi:MAG: glycosyltransferase family 4 protein, partial [Chitinivibrionales bacterium]|nr:glycosyltransferase family 4 protein [Chitinivibrionales bacterium]